MKPTCRYCGRAFIEEVDHSKCDRPKVGEFWVPTAGGPLAQIIVVEDYRSRWGALVAIGEGVEHWTPCNRFLAEYRPLIRLHSVWEFRDGSASGLKVVGFRIDEITFSIDTARIMSLKRGPLTWPVRQFLLEAVPEKVL